jgi:hypothetical protein
VSDRSGCDALAELAPELALGIASGPERARALQHAGGCVDCRRRLQELSETADALLLLAPAREPPNGFETRVLQRLPGGSRRRRRWDPPPRRGAALTAAAMLLVALLAASLAGGGVLLATRTDRDLARSYQEALRTADGRYFATWSLYDTGGDRKVAGTVFGYAGEPSWIFLTLRPPAGEGPFECVLVLDDGRRVDLGTFRLPAGEPSWGRTLGVDLQDAARIELREARAGGRAFVAHLGGP